jgi:DNA-binding transcriptional MocR family regulator
MSRRRRSEIAEIAEAFDLTILEDDAYGMLPSKSVPPVATFAPDRTFYMSSLSKCLSPPLRIAYCVGPRARRAEMTEGVRVVTFLASQLNAGVATQLINDGSAQEMLDAIRAESIARQTIARQSLQGFEMAAHREGPHSWLQLPGEWHVPELGALLRDRGIAAKGDGFAVDGVDPNALRVALGAPASREQLTQVLATLRSTIEEEQLRIR